LANIYIYIYIYTYIYIYIYIYIHIYILSLPGGWRRAAGEREREYKRQVKLNPEERRQPHLLDSAGEPPEERE